MIHDSNEGIYGSFARVYDIFMDNVPTKKPNKSKVKPRPWLKWTIFAVACGLLLKRDHPDKKKP